MIVIIARKSDFLTVMLKQYFFQKNVGFLLLGFLSSFGTLFYFADATARKAEEYVLPARRRVVVLTVIIPDCLSTEHPARPDNTGRYSGIENQVQKANDVYADAGLRFSVRISEQTLTKKTRGRCTILTKRQRDSFESLANSVAGPVVIVVDRIQDDRVASYNLKGLHWRRMKSHWVYLTREARSYVMAHELGHYYGLRHDMKGGNLMAPGPSDPSRSDVSGKPRRDQPASFRPILSKTQIKVIRATLTAK